MAGRYLRDLPSKKIKPFSKDPVSALCAPPGCMADVHQRVRNRLDPDDRTSITQDMIIKSRLLFVSRDRYLCFIQEWYGPN